MPRKKPIRTVQVKDEQSDTLIELGVSADEEAFVTAYFDNNMNATQTYLDLHSTSTYDNARSRGSEIVARRNIRARIDEILREKAMSRDEVLARLGDMARATHRPFVRVADDGFIYFNFADPHAQANFHLIKKIKTKRQRRWVGYGEDAEEWEGEWVEVELHDPQKALELIGKYYKMFSDKEANQNAAALTDFSIPGYLIAPDFVNVYRDIREHRHIEYIFTGGRGSTKSSFVSLVLQELLINNPDQHALVLRNVKDTLRDSVYSQILWAINELGLTDKFHASKTPLEITYLPTGQRIYFRGADEPAKIKSIKPPFGYIGVLVFEELDQFRGPEVVRNIEQSAIRGGDTAIILKPFNPPRTAANWANKYVKIPKESQYQHHSNYLTVPPEWLGRVFLDEAEHLKAINPAAYEHEYMGIANGTGGMVFDNIELRPITDDEISQFDRIHMGADQGFYPDPFSWGKMHYDPSTLTLYIFDELRLFKKRSNEICDALVNEKGVTPGDFIIMDSVPPQGVADFRAYGLNVRGAEKGPKTRLYSYRWLQSLAKIVIDPVRAPYHAQEFTEAEYEKTKDGEIISNYPDKNDHAIDDTRYGMNLVWRRSGE